MINSLKNRWLGISTIKQDQADLGNQVVQNWNNTVKTTGDQTINGNKTFRGTTKLGRILHIGSGNDNFLVSNKESEKSDLLLGYSANNNSYRLDINLQNRSEIKNIPAVTQKNIVYGLKNLDWITVIDEQVPAANTWSDNVKQKDINYPANFWQDNEWYEIVISVKKGDYSRKSFLRFQKYSGENWIVSNNIIINSDLADGGRGEYYFRLGASNTDNNFRRVKISGKSPTAIDKLTIKIRKMV